MTAVESLFIASHLGNIYDYSKSIAWNEFWFQFPHCLYSLSHSGISAIINYNCHGQYTSTERDVRMQCHLIDCRHAIMGYICDMIYTSISNLNSNWRPLSNTSAVVSIFVEPNLGFANSCILFVCIIEDSIEFCRKILVKKTLCLSIYLKRKKSRK